MTENKKTTGYILLAAVVYFAGAAAVVALQLLFHNVPPFMALSLSISSYAGMRLWSTLLYLATSGFADVMLFRYMRKVDAPKCYRYFGYFVVLAFLIVLMLPYGLTNNDFINGAHNIMGIVLFVSFLVHIAIGTVVFRKRKKALLINSAVLLTDLTLLVMFIFFPILFWSYPGIFEFVMVVGYMLSLLSNA